MVANKFEHLALSSNGFLFNTSNGSTFTLNKVGTFILQQLIEGNDKETILNRILEEYEVNEITARRDIDYFMQQLKEMRLISE